MKNVFSFAMNWIEIRYPNAHAHTKGVCSVLPPVHLLVHIYTYRRILATVQFSSEYEEGERKKRSTCMSSLLQFMLRVDRQTDRHAVNVYDVCHRKGSHSILNAYFI